jgi:hypothetical protein
MRKNILKVIVFLLGVGGVFSPVQAVPIVGLSSINNDVQVGEQFDVQVFADSTNIGLDLLSFGFGVITTGNVFTYDNYVVGPGFDDDSPFVPPEVAGSAFPGISDNNVLLATLSFTAIDVGTGSLQVLGLTDNLFLGLAYEVNPISTGWYDIDASQSITIGSASINSVPEPSTIILILSGMIAVVGFKRAVNNS